MLAVQLLIRGMWWAGVAQVAGASTLTVSCTRDEKGYLAVSIYRTLPLL